MTDMPFAIIRPVKVYVDFIFISEINRGVENGVE